MKAVLRMLIAAAMLVGFAASTASAADYGFTQSDVKKGQKIYIKIKKQVFNNDDGAKTAGMHTQAEWAKMFEGDAQAVIDAFKGNGGAAEKYLTGSGFQKHAPYLRAFFIFYASDSGNVPSCG